MVTESQPVSENQLITEPPRKSKQEIEEEEAKPSYRPLFVALSVLLMMIGVLYSMIVSAVGLFFLLASIAGWVYENRQQQAEREAKNGRKS